MVSEEVETTLPPEYFDTAADDVLELYTKLDQTILQDIVRRLVKTGEVTSTAEWQAQQLQEAGLLYDDIIRRVAEMSGASDAQVKALFEDAGIEAMKYDFAIYEAAGLSPIPLQQSPAAAAVLQAGLQKTAGHLQNLTMTTAITTQQAYIKSAALAEMQVESGAFDYVTAIRNAVRNASSAGTFVQYPTGWIDRLDVAVRRACLTGVGQTAAQLSLRYADDMGCDLVETTAHPGARPTHQLWQGQVFSRSGSGGYPDFKGSTGYGTGAGLCGWNCRHSFMPFFEGLSETAYPRDRLDEYNSRTVEYNGKAMSYYDATQKQRGMERDIRAIKRDLIGADTGMKSAPGESLKNAFKQDFDDASVKLKEQEAELQKFLHETGLDRQREREQALGFSHSQSSKAVWANKNMRVIKSDKAVKSASGLPKKVDLPDEKIPHTVNVNLPKLQGIVPAGSSATEVYAMAGKGTSTPIRDLKRLYTQYPEAGPASGWQKKSGTVYAKYHHYVVHWYENNGFVPESEIKLKGAK